MVCTNNAATHTWIITRQPDLPLHVVDSKQRTLGTCPSILQISKDFAALCPFESLIAYRLFLSGFHFHPFFDFLLSPPTKCNSKRHLEKKGKRHESSLRHLAPSISQYTTKGHALQVLPAMTIRVFTWLRSLLHRDKRPLLPLQARSDGAAIGGSGIVLDGQEISSEIDRARLDSIATVVSDEKEVMPIEYSNMGKSSKQTHPGQDEGMEISYAEHTFSFPQWHISNKSEPAGKDSSSSNTGSESAGTTKDGAKMETAADDPSPRPAWYRRKFNHSILGCSLSIELWMILLIVAVALAVGLGVGLGTRKDHLIFGAAFPATGIVAIDLADGQRNFDSFLMATNRSVVQTKFVNGSWATQSTAVDLVSNLIRDASPLMAVSYTYEDELSWRVMFVGKDGYLQEVISNNKTEDWWEGSLGAGRFKYHPDGIGLTSCVNKKYYGILSLIFFNQTIASLTCNSRSTRRRTRPPPLLLII